MKIDSSWAVNVDAFRFCSFIALFSHNVSKKNSFEAVSSIDSMSMCADRDPFCMCLCISSRDDLLDMINTQAGHTGDP